MRTLIPNKLQQIIFAIYLAAAPIRIYLPKRQKRQKRTQISRHLHSLPLRSTDRHAPNL